MRIAHLTTVHPRYDTRIYHKMCRSLQSHGFKVDLIVADGNGSQTVNGVNIIDVGKPKGRFDRVCNLSKKLLCKAVEIEADLYHIHDPELISTGLKLKRMRKQVVFDSHEDIPKQILGKPYLKRPINCVISNLFKVFESWSCRQFDGVIAATPHIRDKFISINNNTLDINNFPLLGELDSKIQWGCKASEICYVGGIEVARGIRELVQVADLVKNIVRLNLCGRFLDPTLEINCKAMLGWESINYFGNLDRPGIRNVLARSIAGLVVLHPLENYITSLPVKMFEYMAAGIPVIASDFPLWREIVLDNKCGICVNPLNPIEIANAVTQVVRCPEVSRQMGENGRLQIQKRYNWSNEEAKLIGYYISILKRRVSKK